MYNWFGHFLHLNGISGVTIHRDDGPHALIEFIYKCIPSVEVLNQDISVVLRSWKSDLVKDERF